MPRFVIFAPNWLGDAVMALPAIDDIVRADASAMVDIAARPSVAPLFSLVPGVREVAVLKDRGGAVETLRSRAYDVAVLLTNSFHTAFVARRAGIPERWGYRTDFRGTLLTRAVQPPRRVHQAEYYQRLTLALGIPAGPLQPRIEVSGATRARGEELLIALGWNRASPLIAFAPGAAYGGAKRWPSASYAALARDLIADGITPVVIGSSADRPAAAEVLAAVPDRSRAIDLAGGTDLPQLAGVLSACRGIVTNDSGAMHLAAAVGLPVTAMFGPTNEHETYPIGRGGYEILTNQVWCRPCMLRECPLVHRCMRGIGVERVAASARRVLVPEPRA